MVISTAYAQDAMITSADGETAVVVGEAASTGNMFMSNMMLILVMVVMFYFLLIRPQQKRFAAHNDMLKALKKGDKVVTAGGLVGTIEKIKDGDDEVVVNLGGDMKVTALRSTIQSKTEQEDVKKPANKTTKKKAA